MKIERMHITASNVPTRSANKLKTEKHQTLSDEAVTFDADRDRKQRGEEQSSAEDSEEKEADVAIFDKSKTLKPGGTIDIVV